ncbi:hypothetical protein [Fusibacter ferrireducens]|uniref:DUF4145 domain-containing protein n=1 Tax=Fusibacter ferrireducens TaxID=2785058 RepID=A0ABR9ZUV8_9FIRM|nr:hypothetical protein [Fusibacter ferrireducens]MBF4694254.1 hypothetical protein [Fusibacter ferrireducens]
MKQDIKIDWTNLLLMQHDILGYPQSNFVVTPLEYLKYSKQDLKEETERGLINSIGNSKRAIDCQVDLLIEALGFKSELFDNKNSYRNVKKFIRENYAGKNSNGLTDKLRLLQILNIAPVILISQIRNLRNTIEHDYQKPNKNSAEEAVEIAELFVHASGSIFENSYGSIVFGSNFKIKTELTVEKKPFSYYTLLPEYCFLELNHYRDKKLRLHLIKNSHRSFPATHYGEPIIDFLPEDKLYPIALKILFCEEYQLLPQLLEHEIDSKFVKYKLDDI